MSNEVARFSVKNVICGIRHASERTEFIAWPFEAAAFGAESLNCRCSAELSLAAPRRRYKLEQGDIVGGRARRRTGNLSGHRAAVGEFPCWAGIMATYCLAGDEQRRDRLAELPNARARRVGLAFIDLGARGMQGRDQNLAVHSDRAGQLGRCRHRKYEMERGNGANDDR